MRIRIVDAFTDRPYAGNPAGVCLLPSGPWPDEGWMQQVAAEVNQAETAFARPTGGEAEADWDLRWFTPTVEVNLCGHATLATAHALRADGAWAAQDAGASVRFATRSGVLIARAGNGASIVLDFPLARPVTAQAPAELAKALGVEPAEVHATGALGDLLVVVDSEDVVRGLEPDLAVMAGLTSRENLRGVIVTAASDEYDFVSRFFAPGTGIAEDPVTGSAHTALAPYWAQRLGRERLTGFQASRRGGVVQVELHGDRVHLIGNAVTVIDGELTG
ncbi:oxidoreductase [Kribbella sp. ALI-6-A]|uniref:PhzF family phenazine biosynthesis protein n=1 Tax=Kribbella sp. ALI-6-A TaxID=1933817 RepID=UPI00097C1926|nr:PhzF family phenazine biosynthesis protein [Kribbella sp. ALI-6-A]ONI68067.1 oxidoreductase [Kribbella sp. ALI-6-A]